MGNSTEIEQLQQNDEANYGVSVEALGTRLELATDTIVSLAYGFLVNIFSPPVSRLPPPRAAPR